MNSEKSMLLPTKKTKIVATLGPATQKEVTIKTLIKNGVNVFRFNMKHSTTDWHEEQIRKVQKVADQLDVPVGILIDLQGPEIRIETKNQQPVTVKQDQEVTIAFDEESPKVQLFLPHPGAFQVLKIGDRLLIDDGLIETKVTQKTQTHLRVKVLGPGTISHRKGVNLPNKTINTPALVEADLKQLDMAASYKVDFVALSFARTKQDIVTLQKELKRRKMQAQIVAKIESQEALDHLNELIETSDALMVARGDLGIEVPIEQLAFWQKEIINRCRLAAKPVITATQMLQSMISSSQPTRAEATDVANAVFDGSDALMLSGETATGKYPIRSVKAMAKIARFAEEKAIPHPLPAVKKQNTTELIIDAAIALLKRPKERPLSAVIIFTETGYTAKILARFRPKLPIIAVTDSAKTQETLSLSYGVIPLKADFPEGPFKLPQNIIEKLKTRKLLAKDQKVLIIHGQHWKQPGLTNALAVTTVA